MNTTHSGLKRGKNPLWLIHGLWVDDYSHNSHKDAYDEGLFRR